MLSDAELAAIRERVEAATAGPWTWTLDKWELPKWLHGHGGAGYSLAELSPCDEPQETTANAAFIAHSREDIPALLAEVERLRAREAALVEVVKQVASLPPDMCACWIDNPPEIAPASSAVEHASDCWIMHARALLNENSENEE